MLLVRGERAPRRLHLAVAPVRTLQFGFSPCPNDTFAFYGAVHGRSAAAGVHLDPVLADIETLNRRAVEQREPPLPLTKLSLPALAQVSDRYSVLPAGAALGFGCGPLVVRRGEDDGLRTLQDLRGRTVAIPGLHTTAHLLLGLFGPAELRCVVARFEQVLPMVARGECDAGLVIHEGRFTYAQHGLVALADLGQAWEGATRLPLPLGVIAAQRELDLATVRACGAALRASVEFARAHPDRPHDFVRRHAQELDPAVQEQHIRLYVNDFTQDLGEAGRAAIDALLARGRAAGLLAAGPSPWRDGA
jgi:1,4-dihydroxy-6-naphthoate synthase